MSPVTFAIMPGRDNAVTFGMATMKELGIDLYPLALETLRSRAVPVQTGLRNHSHLTAGRVTVSIRPLKVASEEEIAVDAAVERLVDRRPDVSVDRAEERGAPERALEERVQQSEHKGQSAGGAYCWRDILARRVDAFRRGLCGDPPARVEATRVQLKPQAKTGNAETRRCVLWIDT